MSKQDNNEKTLSNEQQERLHHCEQIVREGQRAFLKTCVALTVIDKEGLFWPFRSLTAYCGETFDMDDAATTRHKQAGELLLTLSGLSADELLEGKADMLLPNCEGQCREFNKLEPDMQKQVWTEVVRLHNEEQRKITALLIREVVQQMTGTTKEPATKPAPVPCMAKMVIGFDDHEVFDQAGTVESAAEYFGVDCNRDKNNLTLSLKAESREQLFRKLASWSKVYDVQRVVIDFTTIQ
ncbi:MAG: hypothetical protein R3C18_27955 [Planctomycetaceae bacterium]